VYLKSLTLRGFKSFASATTLRFEPGITCVVGPNGSGKSNVVDALAWVMGEQGAKTLRGGKMEDVIFAGTAGRAPLGRAEVSVTIDNTDGALPIEYTEVTITRTLFRNGGSEYQINGQSARLLDIQELLSDSGIGREMHVIVGQGQLDQVLSATPEDRRGFIEEAAGVLKHRKRKEKALRKLEAMQANLIRVQDLVAELRRQLKPLGRQAEVARKAATIQSEVRDARARLLADDLVQFRATLEAEVADETALRARRSEVEHSLHQAQEREIALDTESLEQAPHLAAAQDTFYRLTGLRERFRGTANLAAERSRFLAEEAEEARAAGRDPEAMEADARELREEEARLHQTATTQQVELEAAISHRETVEAHLTEEERRVAAHLRAAADQREGRAKLAGQVNALRTRSSASEEEVGRLTAAREEALARAAEAQTTFATLEANVAGLDQGEVNLDAEYEAAAAAHDAAAAEVERLRDEERTNERDRAAWQARLDALRQAESKDGNDVLIASRERIEGILGSIASLITIRDGDEAAIAAALGYAANAVAVTGLDSGFAALRLLKSEDGGRASMIVRNAKYSDPSTWPSLPGGARYAVEAVTCADDLRGTMTALLERVAIVDDLDRARSLIDSVEGITVATRTGDLVGRAVIHGGSGKANSSIELKAAIEEADKNLTNAQHTAERLRFQLGVAEQAESDAETQAAAALSLLHDSDARLAALAEQLTLANQAVRGALGEAERLAKAIEEALAARERDLHGLAELEERLAAIPEHQVDVDPDTSERDRLREVVAAARQAEMDARLGLRTGEERARAAGQRAEQLERSAAAEREARERAVARREARSKGAVVARTIAETARLALAQIEQSIGAAAARRAELEASRTEREGELLSIRQRIRELGSELEQLTSSVHRDEVARAEQRLRIEQLEQRAVEELGVDLETLMRDYGPESIVPTWIEGEDGTMVPGPTIVYERADQEKRLKAAERQLALLGKVNPLALEEYDALQERTAFLTEQLEDLKKTKNDLMEIVREVDERVESIFTEAYHDTARQFEDVFSRLFPGGEGRLILTDPDNMLTTGVDIEARPPGKKVKRLSLLSGGERSLTAVALLVAIFKARPSPFYVMDEVEAALDDVNLGRLIKIMEELRDNSQLIVITHQKRTMEIADALYGVSMRGDGVTEVISQRLRETESV
jgi:chromosome segregation protein